MAQIEITRPAAKTSRKIVQGHLLAPGDKIEMEMALIEPSTYKEIQDAELTTVPTLPTELIEQGVGALQIDKRFSEPLTSFRSGFGPSAPAILAGVNSAYLIDAIVFLQSDTPQPFATGIVAIIEVRDAAGNPILTESGLEVDVVVAGSGGSLQAGGLTITPFPENAVVAGDVASPVRVRLTNGQAKVRVKATSAGEAQLSLATSSRTVTNSDTETLTFL